MHIYGDDGAAIEALPGLYREFLAHRAAVGVAGIEEEQERRFREYSLNCHEPAETHTTSGS